MDGLMIKSTMSEGNSSKDRSCNSGGGRCFTILKVVCAAMAVAAGLLFALLNISGCGRCFTILKVAGAAMAVAAGLLYALRKPPSSGDDSEQQSPLEEPSHPAITMTNPTPSSSMTNGSTYDVFLSFRGPDTRSGFTGHLYKALCDKGIRTFMDDEELRKGEVITPSLIKAIQESRTVIVVFSKNYASSSFCLEELANIMDCWNRKECFVWPVFYKVKPCDVRHQKGSYAEALAKHETRISDKSKINMWKLALQHAADLSGWHFTDGDGYEYKFIGSIIKEVSKLINPIHLAIADYPVGLESRVQKVKSFLDVESNADVHMVGVYGIGGMGKTTLARAVYNSIADQFESQCFLADIRDTSLMKHGLIQLQKTLLSELVGEKDVILSNVHEGMSLIRTRLSQKKILLILDDVNEPEQLKRLAGAPDWFGPGSRIIITTRDQNLLHVFRVKRTYEVEGLNHEDAIELFSWNAFNTKEVHPNYKDITKRIIKYANGLPLVLEVIGSALYGRTMSEWEHALDTYKRIPHQNIQEILKVSYDGLTEDEKNIFLDIACFFKGYPLSDVKNILLSGRGLSPEYAIRVLIDKCLIKKDYLGRVTMHDQIKDMGREIIRKESSSRPGEQSRLWISEDILEVLEQDKGSHKIEIIMLRLFKKEVVEWDGNAFKKMENLKILIIENAQFSRGPSHLPNSLRVLKWSRYPDQSLPANFNAKKLAILDLSMSDFILDNPQIKKLKCLTEIKLSGCQLFEQVPDMSGARMLKRLILDYCKKLVEVHDSVGFLDGLEYLSAIQCTSLTTLPRVFNLTSLKYLCLWLCVNLKSFPEISGKMENVRNIQLRGSGIRELPFSIGNLVGLEVLDLSECYGLSELPTSVFMLPKLLDFNADRCKRIKQLKKGTDQEQEAWSSKGKMTASFKNCCLTDEFFPTFFPYLHNVKILNLGGSNITMLPTSINTFQSLTVLNLDGCMKLQEIRGLPPNIKWLFCLNCTSLTSQSEAILLSQTLHNGGLRELVVPGSIPPNGFNHCTSGPSLSFWFDNKLPAFILCVVGCTGLRGGEFPKLMLTINNGQRFKLCEIEVTKQMNHIYLSSQKLNDKSGIENGWNHGVISYFTDRESLINIKWIGVQVQEQHANLIDFSFTVPMAKGQVPIKGERRAKRKFFDTDGDDGVEDEANHEYEDYGDDDEANHDGNKGKQAKWEEWEDSD